MRTDRDSRKYFCVVILMMFEFVNPQSLVVLIDRDDLD